MSAPLGILMLDTKFDRPPGDIGNAASFPFPVLYRTICGATARRVVDGHDADLIEAFVAAGEALIASGAACLTTSCGFLAMRQRTLAERFSVPFAASSLLQIPLIERCLPAGKRAGVVTYDAAALTDAHLVAVGASPATAPRIGLPRGGAWHALIEGGARYDAASLEAELAATIERLLIENTEIGALVFECTNLPPFSAAMRRRFGLPIHDCLTLACWLHAGAGRQETDA